ncbi:MAG: RNA-binding protein [Candidatus Riflebacteria bacterium]|nr:RNA-binding protein [Candidatus Riflebacteria bacterium]
MRIYVGNLSYETTQADVQDLFGQHGEVREVVFPMDRDTGRPKGFAFVDMPNQDEAQKAMSALNNQTVNSRTITVNEARPKPARTGGGFGGGGGGGGGGFGGKRGGRDGRRDDHRGSWGRR